MPFRFWRRRSSRKRATTRNNTSKTTSRRTNPSTKPAPKKNTFRYEFNNFCKNREQIERDFAQFRNLDHAFPDDEPLPYMELEEYFLPREETKEKMRYQYNYWRRLHKKASARAQCRKCRNHHSTSYMPPPPCRNLGRHGSALTLEAAMHPNLTSLPSYPPIPPNLYVGRQIRQYDVNAGLRIRNVIHLPEGSESEQEPFASKRECLGLKAKAGRPASKPRRDPGSRPQCDGASNEGPLHEDNHGQASNYVASSPTHPPPSPQPEPHVLGRTHIIDRGSFDTPSIHNTHGPGLRVPCLPNCQETNCRSPIPPATTTPHPRSEASYNGNKKCTVCSHIAATSEGSPATNRRILWDLSKEDWAEIHDCPQSHDGWTPVMIRSRREKLARIEAREQARAEERALIRAQAQAQAQVQAEARAEVRARERARLQAPTPIQPCPQEPPRIQTLSPPPPPSPLPPPPRPRSTSLEAHPPSLQPRPLLQSRTRRRLTRALNVFRAVKTGRRKAIRERESKGGPLTSTPPPPYVPDSTPPDYADAVRSGFANPFPGRQGSACESELVCRFQRVSEGAR
ncbi:hypothetical protein CC80DRAFT_55006 [Byssothecium circinans]|uniref:Uncharacterized protein n=1 Tax=Byssothecium circinans TaxID=147558 RepID=A0A6A5TWZ0_9PLEO|nr:hypothetical protein CC80DRAFT_55006 [Byssothecium circinans]